MKGHHYLLLLVVLAIGAWYAVKRGWLRKPTASAPASAGGESL